MDPLLNIWLGQNERFYHQMAIAADKRKDTKQAKFWRVKEDTFKEIQQTINAGSIPMEVLELVNLQY